MYRSVRLLLAAVLLSACSHGAMAREQAVAHDGAASDLDDNAPASVDNSGYGVTNYAMNFDVEVAQAAAIGDPVLELQEQSERLMIRRGFLTLQTANPEEVGKRAAEVVRLAGGWVQRQHDSNFAFRIPAARFDEVLATVEGMGVVTSRRIEAEDVTGEVRDLELRVKNARALRDRYAELLKRAVEVKDLLAIEKQLAEVTEEIERIEGQLKRRRHDISFSLLQLQLSAAQRAPDRASRSPFTWLTRIGIERVPQYRPDRAWSSRVDWVPPEGYADMGRTDDKSVRGWLYSPEGVRIVVRRFDNKPRVDEAFWTKELRRELVRVRGYRGDDGQEPGMLLFRSGGEEAPTLYGVRLIVTKSYVTVVEVVGPMVVVAEQMDAIRGVVEQVERD